MNLIWKLLRQHISVPQLAGFSFANLFGMFIVLLGYQAYKDILPIFAGDNSILGNNYMVMSKRITTGSTLSGTANTFSQAEITDISEQRFAEKVGKFTATEYKVNARMGVNGVSILSSELFFESIPDNFVDVPLDSWQWKPGDTTIPIVLPRSYLTMYNFGFAQSHSMPKISDGLVGLIDLTLYIQANGANDVYKGRVIGFSNRLNSVLVPQAFMDWSNGYYAPGKQSQPSRLIMEVANTGDDRIIKYVDEMNYEVEDDKLNAEKSTYLLRMTVSAVMLVGLVISILSFYILMLSVYLLVQKNAEKLENLLLIGYTPARVALPYQLLTIGLNLAVLVIALVLLAVARNYYIGMITMLFPEVSEGSMMPAILLGVALLAFVSVINIAVICRKVTNIWKHKE